MRVQKKESKTKENKMPIIFLIVLILLFVIDIFIYENNKLIVIQEKLEDKYSDIDNYYIEVISEYNVTVDNEDIKEKNISKYISYKNEMNIFSKTDNQNELRSYIDKEEKMDAVWFYDAEKQTNITNYLMYRPVQKIISIENIIDNEISNMKSSKYICIEETFDNKNCIVFRSEENQKMQEIYFEKETLLPLKTAYYNKKIDSDDYILNSEKIFDIKLNTVSKSDILIPNKDSFSKVEFTDIYDLEKNKNISESAEIKSIQSLGKGIVEKFKILNTEDSNVEYFSISNDENIKYAEIENYSTYEKFTSKWENLKKLKKEDFKNYKVYILINTDITKDMNVKEKIISYDSTVENYILDVIGKTDTSYNTGILIIEPIKNYGMANFVELKNKLVIKSDEETMNMIASQKEMMLQYIREYAQNQELQIASDNRGGILENVIPTDFFETQGKSNNTLEKEERTCWVEQIGFKNGNEEQTLVLRIYVDAETKELIAAKID